MIKPLSTLLFCSLGCAIYAQDVPPLDPKQILQELEAIQTKQQTVTTTLLKRNLDLIFKAAATKDTAIAFYEEAQMVTQFQGANRENAQFREWKKRAEEQLKNSDFRESVRLHLYYLALSLKKASDTKPAELVPQVVDYLKVLEAAEDALEVEDSLLKKSVADGIFAKWLGLEPDLQGVKDWEMNPGKPVQIATKYVLPEWRKQKNPALLTYWDARIARESAAAGTVKVDFQEKNYATLRKPDLLWQKAQEYIVLDQPNKATQEMFGLIKTYPNHPNIGQWIETLKKTLAGSTPAEVKP